MVDAPLTIVGFGLGVGILAGMTGTVRLPAGTWRTVLGVVLIGAAMGLAAKADRIPARGA